MANEKPQAPKSGPSYPKGDDLNRDEAEMTGRDAGSEPEDGCGCSGGKAGGSQAAGTKGPGQNRVGASDSQDEDAARRGSDSDAPGVLGGSRLPGDAADGHRNEQSDRKNEPSGRRDQPGDL